MIHLYDNDPRQNDPDYTLNHGSFAAVHINLNKALKKLGHYADVEQAEYVGCCDGLNIGFKYKDKKSFLISVWEQSELPFYHINTAYQSGQKLFGLSCQISALWQRYGFDCPVVYGGCDTDFWQQTKEKSKHVFKFLHVNSSNIRSGLDKTLLAFCYAFENNNDVCLHVKDTNESLLLREEISKLIGNFNVNIVYENHREPMTYIRDLYSESHVTLNVLRSTSFGMPLLDSTACGSLCVTGNIAPCNELVGPTNGVLIEPSDMVEIHRMQPILKTWGLLDCFPSLNYAVAPQFAEYDTHKYAAKLLDIYKNYEAYKHLINRQYIIDNWSWERGAKQLITHLC